MTDKNSSQASLLSTPLGKQGPKVSRLALGCMGMSDFYRPEAQDRAKSIAVIHHAIDQGVTLLDTADMYGPHTNEVLVGEALAGRRRDAVMLATKFGQERREDGSFVGINGRPEYVQKCCDASLRRLGVDHIDLYYQHRVDPNVPIEETVGAMTRLVDAGKVRLLGLSEASCATIRRAHKVHPIAAVQSEYALWWREPEEELLATLRGLGITLVCYGALGRGFLTGTFKTPKDLSAQDARLRHPRFSEENMASNAPLVAYLGVEAKKLGVSPSQLALAWVLAQGNDVVALFGTTRRERIDENLAALGLRLEPGLLDRLDQRFPQGIAKGDRYADMRQVNR